MNGFNVKPAHLFRQAVTHLPIIQGKGWLTFMLSFVPGQRKWQGMPTFLYTCRAPSEWPCHWLVDICILESFRLCCLSHFVRLSLSMSACVSLSPSGSMSVCLSPLCICQWSCTRKCWFLPKQRRVDFPTLCLHFIFDCMGIFYVSEAIHTRGPTPVCPCPNETNNHTNTTDIVTGRTDDRQKRV